MIAPAIEPHSSLAISEKAWDAQLFASRKGLATTLGWDGYHTLRSKGSDPGFPDRVIWRDRMLFVELKSEIGRPTAHQAAVLTALATAGAETYLWRPSDLVEVAKVLATRWIWSGGSLSRDGQRRDIWRPGSLWTPAGCRLDDAVGV